MTTYGDGKAQARSAAALCGLALACLLAVGAAFPAIAQERKPKPKRPTLKVRVVAPDKGVPVVVSEADGSTADAGADAQPAEPEVENWLVDNPPGVESWLTTQAPPTAPAPGAPAEPAQTPSSLPERASSDLPQQASSDLVGVQHYMESVGAGSTEAAATTSVPFEPPPSNPATPVRVASPSTAPARGEQPVSNPALPPRPAAPDDANRYRLGPGDQIDVHVWRNPELTRSVPVRPDGIISLPLAGELMASGKTVAELEREITAVLGEFVQYPTVTVSVTEVRGMVVYVVGRVASPGTLQLDRPVNIVQAIAMAGGMQEFADRNGVVVIRTVNGRETRLPFRYGDALKGKSDEAPIILQSGDVIYVP